eukprot:1187581-Prorocentrum_minimum.AAC.1
MPDAMQIIGLYGTKADRICKGPPGGGQEGVRRGSGGGQEASVDTRKLMGTTKSDLLALRPTGLPHSDHECAVFPLFSSRFKLTPQRTLGLEGLEGV